MYGGSGFEEEADRSVGVRPPGGETSEDEIIVYEYLEKDKSETAPVPVLNLPHVDLDDSTC